MMTDEPMPTDAAGVRAYDDAIEAARREEALAEKRGDLRTRLAALTPESREALRCLVDLVDVCEDAYRDDPENVDDREYARDLIDEAEAYASGRDDLAARFERPGVVSSATGVEAVLGTDFRGLTASAGAVREAFATFGRDEGAQVWLAFPTAPGSREHVSLGSFEVADDGRIVLVAAGIPTAIAQATS